MGSPDFALPSLQLLHEGGHEIIVFTQPPRPKGRGYMVQKTAVAEFAEKLNYPVYCPSNLHDGEILQILSQFQPDYIIVVAYGLILSQEILNLPKIACWNLHGSLLPQWRGAAPIERAILAGDELGGFSIQNIALKLDSGDIIAQESVPILQKTALVYRQELSILGAQKLAWLVNLPANQLPIPQAQNHNLATFAPKITKEELWCNLTNHAQILQRQIRAFNMQGCSVEINNIRYKIFNAQEININIAQGEIRAHHGQVILGAGQNSALILNEIQPAGKNRLKNKDIFNYMRNIGLIS